MKLPPPIPRWFTLIGYINSAMSRNIRTFLLYITLQKVLIFRYIVVVEFEVGWHTHGGCNPVSSLPTIDELKRKGATCTESETGWRSVSAAVVACLRRPSARDARRASLFVVVCGGHIRDAPTNVAA